MLNLEIKIKLEKKGAPGFLIQQMYEYVHSIHPSDEQLFTWTFFSFVDAIADRNSSWNDAMKFDDCAWAMIVERLKTHSDNGAVNFGISIEQKLYKRAPSFYDIYKMFELFRFRFKYDALLHNLIQAGVGLSYFHDRPGQWRTSPDGHMNKVFPVFIANYKMTNDWSKLIEVFKTL